jgi:hypothetical protein
MPKTIMLHHHSGREWSCSGSAIGQPLLEKCADHRMRLVVEIGDGILAADLRNDHALAVVPAAIDSTEALVRAAHELAGAALELKSVLREAREK